MRNITLFICMFMFSGLVVSCKSVLKEKLPVENSSTYDLNNPLAIKLPIELDEISGIVYSPMDTAIFAVTDEDGVLYKIGLANKSIIQSWRFDKKRDYEELMFQDGIFYVLVSNGDIESIRVSDGNAIELEKSEFPDTGNSKNEFEAMYYDDGLEMLILLCKDCDGKKSIAAWGYSIYDRDYVPFPFELDLDSVAQKLGIDKINLKPSGAAVNPVTNEVYILASINKLIIITDRSGKFIDLIELDPAIYEQPEGITFDNQGNLYISNEKGRGNHATILQFLLKSKVR
ncbi:SdiA-regulated domain-containing protein [Lacibacter sediminis]|uniref:SdiA-regulated domain-containing protein n=1 Tax=Lacibacter sediminis TaxID=2760713 RepID=A0A7G5XKA4_9BACT|nr:SdiA-regulated domain-containing protein [Lacibacter sediminis]QNA45907.1 SdiA-regulated domain-containing protein [Lacibacter sediminis]